MRLSTILAILLLLFTFTCCAPIEETNENVSRISTSIDADVDTVAEGNGWYWVIGFWSMLIFACMWIVGLITFKDQLLDYLKTNHIFYDKVSKSYYEYDVHSVVEQEGFIDNRMRNIMLLSYVSLFVTFFLYPIVIGVLIGLYLYYEFLSKSSKYIRIKDILTT